MELLQFFVGKLRSHVKGYHAFVSLLLRFNQLIVACEGRHDFFGNKIKVGRAKTNIVRLSLLFIYSSLIPRSTSTVKAIKRFWVANFVQTFQTKRVKREGFS